ncbi:MAG: hypothetical protein DME26_12515 [Verrucomicrobia bacterium]|nr:MAG: hypothetical protein DME26_12515 [Verrucomicrobiota bacterium]
MPNRCGTPQGGVISPLLANVYLNPLDHGVNEKCVGQARMFRYADDFVITCRRARAGEVRERTKRWLDFPACPSQSLQTESPFRIPARVHCFSVSFHSCAAAFITLAIRSVVRPTTVAFTSRTRCLALRVESAGDSASLTLRQISVTAFVGSFTRCSICRQFIRFFSTPIGSSARHERLAVA